jgi:hypothetical protein
MLLGSDEVEAQEELVGRWTLLQPDNGADLGQQLARAWRVVRVRQRRIQGRIRLTCHRLDTVQADMHALYWD